MMHDAVHSYLEQHDCPFFNIQAIALEGDGVVADRVNTLYAALTARAEWVKAVQEADVIFLATHSQGESVECALFAAGPDPLLMLVGRPLGAVVSTHLLARMFERKLVRDGGKVHLLAMCAVFAGPCESLRLSDTFLALSS